MNTRFATKRTASIAENGALVAYSGVKTGRSPKDKRVVKHPDSENRRLVGPGQHPVRRADLRDQSSARARLPEHTRAPLLLRRIRGMGPEVPHQDPRDLFAPLPRALHAHHADSADAERTGELRQARFHDLQRRARFRPIASPAGMGSTTSIALSLEDRELVILGTEYAGEMKKGVFTVANYFAPRRGILSMHCSATARPADGAVVASLRAQRHRQDDAVGRSETAPDRRRRALLERRRHLQYRRGLLREGDQSHARERAGHLPGAALRGRARERGPRRGPHRRTSPTRASRRTRAARIRSNSSTVRRSRASPAIRPTSSS